MPEPPPAPDPPADAAPDWSALMVRAQDGDRAAYLAVLAAAAPLVRRMARRALRDPDLAEDAVQDTLLTLHQVRHTYDPARPFRPWLAAIAGARIADLQRRAVRRHRREAALEPRHETLPGPPTNHDETTDRGRLARAIAELPEAEQRAVRLLKLEELSLQEAATRTGISVTALKVACHRAIKRLRLRWNLLP